MTAARVSCLLLAFGTAAAIAAVDAKPSRAADGDKRTAARSDRLGSLSQRFATEDQSELLLLLDELPQTRDIQRPVFLHRRHQSDDATLNHASNLNHNKMSMLPWAGQFDNWEN